MKPILLTLLLLCLCAEAQSQPPTSTIQVSWNPSLSSLLAPGLAYTLYIGTNSGQYSSQYLPSTNLTQTVSNLTRGVTYYFAATCTTSNGLTSPFSNESTYNSGVVPVAPTGLAVKVITP